jgi:hypothetical protein
MAKRSAFGISRESSKGECVEPSERTLAYHAIDPESGFMATTGGYSTAFDGDRKAQFLEVYKRECLGIRKACRAMGMSVSTVNHHLQIDPVFREAFDAAEREYIEDLECTSRVNALNPKSVIERIFQLKCLLPVKYGQENKQQEVKVNFTFDGSFLENARKRSQVVDAQVVSDVGKERLGLDR